MRSISVTAATLAVLAASHAGSVRAEGTGADPDAGAPHQLFWNEVRPAPIPRGVPWLGAEGVDEVGHPRRAPDVAALRSLLVHGSFGQLTALLESLQTSFEKDPRRERWVDQAFRGFGSPHPKELERIERWLQATPRSYVPYLARGLYWYDTAMVQRGTKAARETSEAELLAMREALQRARADLRQAQSMHPRLVLARTLEFDVEFLLGNRARAHALMESTLAACPSCQMPRVTWLERLEPRWGGSLEQMEEYVRRARTGSPLRRVLQGNLELERAWEASAEGRPDEARTFTARACALGPKHFSEPCIREKVERSDFAGVVEILDRAVALNPGAPGLLLERAWYLARLNRWEDAGRDLLYAVRCEPTSGRRTLRQVVPALDALGWRAHLAGRRADALRLYSLATDLAPEDAELAGRAEKVRASAAPSSTAGQADGSPEDGRPELRLLVLDRDGRPVPGAAVLHWFRLHRGAGIVKGLAAKAQGERTDASGRLRTTVSMGDRTVLAWMPGGAQGAVGWLNVPVTGASLTLTVGGSRRTTGTVVDTAKPPAPVAGLEVVALPEEPDTERARLAAAATTASDGTFVLDGLDDGPYRVFTVSDKYVSSERGEPLPIGERRIDLQVQRMQTLSGSVLVAEPGRPPSPADQVVISCPGFGKKTLSTVGGRFSFYFMAPSKESRVMFSVEGKPPVVRTLDLTRLDNDAGEVVIGSGRTVRGRVVDEDGAPVWQAGVSIASAQRLATTNIDGSFQASVPDGPVDLSAWHPDRISATRTVRAEEDQVTITLRAGGRFKVLVVAEDGTPVGEARVIRTNQSSSCLTDPSGRCELKGIADAEECIHAGAPPGRLSPPALCIPTTPGAVRSVVYRLPRSATRLTARVLNPDGESIDALVHAFSGAESYAAAVSPAGRSQLPHHWFRSTRPLPDVPHGRYLLVAWGDGGCAAATVDMRAADTASVTMTLGDGSCSR